ncbi:MAG: hypothetical protein SFY56_14700 [Bacteroidota bacterium]|nr:hypothetical protein [Bacteroidota bacterium]
MAKASYLLSNAIRKAALNLQNNKPYEWGHMGNCNCGHLAQTLLNINKAEIHRYAMEKHGDWNEQLNDYCPTSGLLMDKLIWNLLQTGLAMEDIMDLEYLRNPKIVEKIDDSLKPLVSNKREHVIAYLNTWATIMEDELTENINLNFNKEKTLTVK